MNDPESEVSKRFKDKRTYVLLEEINVGPAVRYMTKIRNTDKVIAGDSHHGKPHGKDEDENPHKKPSPHNKENTSHEGEAHS